MVNMFQFFNLYVHVYILTTTCKAISQICHCISTLYYICIYNKCIQDSPIINHKRYATKTANNKSGTLNDSVAFGNRQARL